MPRLESIFVAVLLCFSSVAAQVDNKSETSKSAAAVLIQSVKGADLFRAYCASCHGPTGVGNGPVAPALKLRPLDLTAIAERNHGKFPTDRIARVIAVDDRILPHGSREMPVWGPIFHEVEKDQDWGEVRVHNLVEYLRSIQRQPTNSKSGN